MLSMGPDPLTLAPPSEKLTTGGPPAVVCGSACAGWVWAMRARGVNANGRKRTTRNGKRMTPPGQRRSEAGDKYRQTGADLHPETAQASSVARKTPRTEPGR